MNWYSIYKNEWKEIIETVASEEKRSNTIVEKDLIQSLFLYELSKYNLPFVFSNLGLNLGQILRNQFLHQKNFFLELD